MIAIGYLGACAKILAITWNSFRVSASHGVRREKHNGERRRLRFSSLELRSRDHSDSAHEVASPVGARLAMRCASLREAAGDGP